MVSSGLTVPWCCVLTKSGSGLLATSPANSRSGQISLLQATGRPGTAVQWGAWGGGGMAQRVPGFVGRMERQGLGLLPPETGLAVLGAVLAAATAPALVHPPPQPVIIGKHAIIDATRKHLHRVIALPVSTCASLIRLEKPQALQR